MAEIREARLVVSGTVDERGAPRTISVKGPQVTLPFLICAAACVLDSTKSFADEVDDDDRDELARILRDLERLVLSITGNERQRVTPSSGLSGRA